MKIVNMKRFITFCIVMVLILSATLALVINAFASDERVVVDEVTHYVTSGDTLWEICSLYCPDDMDIREYIHNVQQYNGGISANLQIGQEVVIPIYASK